jgi:hypothetical protein
MNGTRIPVCWVDELAKAYDMKVLHHAQHLKRKEELL